MIISSRIMVSSRAPIRYIIQPGVTGTWTGSGGGGGNGCGAGCGSGDSADGVAGISGNEGIGGRAGC